MKPITREELEAELARLGLSQTKPDASIRTSSEWAGHWGCSQAKALDLLKTAKGHGLIRVTMKQIRRIDDKTQQIAAYQFLQEEKPRAKGARRK